MAAMGAFGRPFLFVQESNVSHPLDIENYPDKYLPTLPKCAHGLYIANGKDGRSSACMGCRFEAAQEKRKVVKSNRRSDNATVNSIDD